MCVCEDVLNAENDQTDKQSSSNQKKGVKRRKVSASESDKDTTPPQPKKTLQIKSKKKKKEQLPEKKKHSRVITFVLMSILDQWNEGLTLALESASDGYIWTWQYMKEWFSFFF